MMPRPPRIRVYDSDHPPDDWRRFLAVLCLIGFWGQLHHGGYYLVVLFSSPPWQREGEELASMIQAVSVVCASLCLWALARALWGRPQPMWPYMLGLLVCLIFSVWGTVAWCEVESSGPHTSAHWWFQSNRAFLRFVRWVVGFSSDQLRWTALGIVASMFRAHRLWAGGRRSRWAICAATWSFTTAALAILTWPFGAWLGLGWVPLPSLNKHPLIALLHVGLPLLSGVWLLQGWRLCWGPPLAIVALRLLSLGRGCYTWVLSDNPANPEVIVSEVQDWFIWSVYLAGPWLVIAWWAWRYPTRAPADDGTPLPRWHCANCLYNLQGLTSDRCPECGAITGTPTEQHTQATHELLSDA